eukprot:359401-Chlamydomonas_euryale.AAC.5
MSLWGWPSAPIRQLFHFASFVLGFSPDDDDTLAAAKGPACTVHAPGFQPSRVCMLGVERPMKQRKARRSFAAARSVDRTARVLQSSSSSSSRSSAISREAAQPACRPPPANGHHCRSQVITASHASW